VSRETDTATWTRTDADRKAVAAGCWFDLPAAERIRAFMWKFLRHSKGAFGGKPFELLEWQWREFIAPLFGWKRPDGTRRYRRGSVWISKKNGKSTLAAALVIIGLLGDSEPGANVYSAAADREQASIIFHEAANMVRQSPALAKHLDPVDTTKRIVHRNAGAFYQVLSKESKKTGHGINASMVVIDELHVVDRETYETLRYAGAARRQPLFIEISTAGNNRDSLGFERYTYAKRVRDGEIEDPELLPLIYEADSNDVWAEPEQWKKANPSLGVTITEDSFRADFREASQGTAATQASFKQLRLDLWQDSVSTWVAVELWDACRAPMTDEQLEGLPCWAAIDLASKMDLVASAFLFGLHEAAGYYLRLRFWCPEDADSARQRANKTLLRPWIQAGHIKATPGNVTDYDQVEQDFLADARRFGPKLVAYDPWNATQIVTHLMTALGSERLREFAQTIKNYNDPMKEMERLIRCKEIRHDGNPVMRFCVKNVMVQRDTNDNQRPTKGKSADKIDGVTAGLMSLGLAMQVPPASGDYYESHDLEMA
jgi:phage terminase large subunit-like protein